MLFIFFFFSSRRRHTRLQGDWSSDVCSCDLMFLMAISGAVIFPILRVSANTMAMSVRERVREVGILKTLGFTPGSILGMILGEACAISVAGGTIGYLISTLLMRVVAKSPFGAYLPAFQPFEYPVAVACVLIAGAI